MNDTKERLDRIDEMLTEVVGVLQSHSAVHQAIKEQNESVKQFMSATRQITEALGAECRILSQVVGIIGLQIADAKGVDISAKDLINSIEASLEVTDRKTVEDGARAVFLIKEFLRASEADSEVR